MAEDDTTEPEVEEMRSPEGLLPTSVPLDRFNKILWQRNEARKQVAEIDGLRALASQASTFREQLAHEKAGRASDARAASESLSIMGIGIDDPDGVAVARALHGRLTGDDAPSIGDWLQGFKDDPASAPRALTPYFAALPPADPNAPPPAVESAPRTPMAAPSSVGALASAQAPADPVSAQRIKEIREEAVRTGDWSVYKQVVQPQFAGTAATNKGKWGQTDSASG